MDLQLDTELNLFSDFLSIEFDRTINSALNLDPIFSLWSNQRVSSMIKIISLSEPNVSNFLKTALSNIHVVCVPLMQIFRISSSSLSRCLEILLSLITYSMFKILCSEEAVKLKNIVELGLVGQTGNRFVQVVVSCRKPSP